MEKRAVTILGATGSIGASSLDVIARHPGRYRVFALTARTNVERLAGQCARFEPEYAVLADAARLDEAKALMAGLKTRVLAGPDALEQVASDERCDTVIAAIVGAVGLAPTLAAVRAGKRVLLANKEALVMAGPLFMREVEAGGAVLLPLDSEHNGVFQCLSGVPERDGDKAVEKIILTASGGPFLNTPVESLAAVTPEQACAHPNWDMGAKISVDSATLMNKGLEVIEACWLFGLAPEQIEVVVHPQSIVHAMVAFKDGSILAQMAQPDMRVPIACALAWPERIASGVEPLDFSRCSRLELFEVDERRFLCLPLAYRALRAGPSAVIALNAANEVAVGEFLAGRLGFDRIPAIVAEVVEGVVRSAVETAADGPGPGFGSGPGLDGGLEAIIAADTTARAAAGALVRAAASDSGSMTAPPD